MYSKTLHRFYLITWPCFCCRSDRRSLHGPFHYEVIGAEARGFLIGAPVAYRLGAGFVPARKPGKLPRTTYSEAYSLEYGTDSLEIHQDALGPDDHVLIVDDLVATGGTCVASAKLAEKAGATVEGFGFILELAFLKPRDTMLAQVLLMYFHL